MRHRAVWLVAALLIGSMLSGPGQAQQITNLIQNGGFETGAMSPWNSYANAPSVRTQAVVRDCVGADVPEGPIEGSYCLYVNVTTLGANNYAIGLSPRPQQPYQQNKKYTYSVFMKCKTGTLQVTLKPELAADPWTGYGSKVVTITDKWAEYYTTTQVFTSTVTPGQVSMHIGYAVAEFWVDDAKLYEGDYVPTVVKNKFGAQSPTPDNKAVDVPFDPTLSWKAGPFANTHNVYFGPTFEDVNTASLAQAVSKGQTGTTYKVAELLEFGKTYYWRVDEVNAPPDATVFKSDVWSFTVEPYTYPITGVTATASSSDKTTTGPTNTVNGSGLANDLHSTASDAMWLSSMTDPGPVWIRYAFDKVYKLDELWVWNYNAEFEPVLGYGLKDVTIEYSTDGTTWTALKDVQFAQATAAAGYAHNTVVSLDGVMARYIRLTANSNWSAVGLEQYGLSEVRFFHLPVEARSPQPAQYAENVSVDAVLDWRPGREATSHMVSYGTDKAAVAGGTAMTQTVTDHGLDVGPFDFGTTYYWKVDEVGDVTYPGGVWSFTTEQYAVVEDFESYTDEDGSRIYQAWIDGWTNNTGSTVGYLQAPFAERTIVHGGKQSMPFEYNNVNSPYYSETQRTFDTPQDWTISGADSLTLYYRGFPVGFADKGGNAFTLSSTGTDIWGNADQFRFVYKQLNGNGSITARVDSLTNTHAWAKAGVMIREGLEDNARHAMVVMTPSSGASFQRRESNGGTSTSTDATGLNAPYWVRLTRTGNAFKAERSPDGKTWTQIGTDLTITMATPTYVGLAVTSHNVGVYCTAEFSNVATTGTVTGQWRSQSIGVTQWGNGPAPLYVTVEDRTGKKATVTHPDPAATTAAVWTEWRIPFVNITGVNLAAVKKLTFGVGDKANPKPGAAGMLYVDDILFGKPILPVGLVAHYTFEDSVDDISGNGHYGTILGAPTYVNGPVGKGKAMLFPGTAGNAVNLGTFNPSEKTGMLSVALWAQWNGLTTYWQGLIGKRDNWNTTDTMWQLEANQTTGALTFSRYGVYPASGNPVLKVGEWTHIAVTFDKTTARFYVNGSQTGSGAFSFGPAREASLQIGADNSGGGNPFNGALDDVRLYDIVLTPAEVLTLAGK